MTTSSGQQTSQQNTQTQPWQPAIPALTSILGNIQGLQGQSGINTTENQAIQQLTQNAGGIPNFAPQYGQQAAAFGGGDPFNIIHPAYQGYGNLIQQAGVTNPADLNPLNTPGLSNALNTINTDITNQIQGEFAGAGRTGSGYDTETLARGLGQGESAALLGQYNTNTSNFLNTLQNYFNAGLGANNAQSNNVGSGAALAGSVPQLATQGPGTLLNAGQVPFNLLTGNQGALAGLTVPIAGLGGQSQGTQTSNYSQTASPLAAGLGVAGLFGGGANSAASGIGGVLGRLPFLGGLFGGA